MIQSEPSEDVGPAGALADLVSRLPSSQAAAEIMRLVEVEDDLVAANLLAPYADLLPVALGLVPADRLAPALEQLSPAQACRALFGSFRALSSEHLAGTFAAMRPQALARLLGEMALGYDLPRIAARLLVTLGEGSGPALLTTEPSAAARICGLLPRRALEGALGAVPAADALTWLSRVLAVASPWEVASLLDVIAVLPLLSRPSSTGVLPETAARLLDDWSELPLDDLLGRSPRQALRQIPATTAGLALCELSVGRPELAGFLLSTMADLVLIREHDGQLHRVLHLAPGAAVLATLDPGNERVQVLLGNAAPDILERLLSRLDPVQAAGLRSAFGTQTQSWAPVAYPPTSLQGSRYTRSLGSGLRWVQLREQTVRLGNRQPLRTDLLELDLAHVQLRACQAPDPDPPISAAALTSSLSTGRGGSLPAEEELASLGLVRLAQSLAESGAIAGINGNFYFDYGHCLDAQDLGIDLSEETALSFGDLVGWFVSDGKEVSPALFGRAVLAVTADGKAHIRRVSMTEVVLASGRRLRWDGVNSPGLSGTVLYDRRAGPRTPWAAPQVDVVITGTTIAEIHPGGGARIPLLGFVLSLPARLAREAMPELQIGESVAVLNDFPASLGLVDQAMACGPRLVRDGQIDIDLEAEGFGDKDSSVLPLSLTRAVDSFRAARSFLFTRAGSLTLGVVSGTQLGSGPPRVSVGVTFGELAQLCADLGAEDAVALDGGGSSSVVAVVNGSCEVLSVPTGGGDVPEGVERFLKTYWQVLPLRTVRELR